MISRLLLCVSLFLLSTTARSETLEICFSDLNICSFVTYGSNSTDIAVHVPNEVLKRLDLTDVSVTGQGMGIFMSHVFEADRIRLKAAAGANSLTLNADVTLNDLLAFGPEERGVIKEFRDCVGGVAACSGASLSISATGIFGYLAAKGVCTWTGFQCASAIMSYQEWKKVKTEARKIQREKDLVSLSTDEWGNSGSNGNEGSSGTSSSGGGWSGSEENRCIPKFMSGESCWWARATEVSYDGQVVFEPGHCQCTGGQDS